MVIVYILVAAFTQAAIMNLPRQAQEASRGTVARMDPELDKLVPPDAKVEKVHGDFGFIEGPVWVRSDGYLLFSDIPKNSVMKWTPDGKVVAIRTSIFAGAFPEGVLIGTNGLTLDGQGRIVAAEHGNRRVSRFEKNGSVTVLADRYQGCKGQTDPGAGLQRCLPHYDEGKARPGRKGRPLSQWPGFFTR
jgi:gluconolactonase